MTGHALGRQAWPCLSSLCVCLCVCVPQVAKAENRGCTAVCVRGGGGVGIGPRAVLAVPCLPSRLLHKAGTRTRTRTPAWHV